MGKSESQGAIKTGAGGDEGKVIRTTVYSMLDGHLIKAEEPGKTIPVLTDSIDPGSTDGIVPNAPAVHKEDLNAGLTTVPLMPQEKQKELFSVESSRDGNFIKAGDGGEENPVLTGFIDPGSTNGIIPDAPAVKKEGLNAGLTTVPFMPQEKQKGLFSDESFGDGIIIKAGDEGRKNSALADSIDPGSTDRIIPNAPAVNKEGGKADINIVPLVSQEKQKRLFSVDSLKDSVFIKTGESEEEKRFLINPLDLSPATGNAKEEGDFNAGTKISSLYRVNEDRQMALAQEGLEKKDLIQNQETTWKVEAGQPQLFEPNGSPGNSINPENNPAHKLPSSAHFQRSLEMVLPQEQIFTVKRHGPSSLEVFLEPEGLGKLNIELKMTDHHLHAQIMVNDSIGKELIENNLPQLLSELGKEG
ncbi:MAG: flagellar hook-length control protein FliK, partial [Deltaproteobacteria bacterium]|nr:flagellar hook-length control protein FliK [Deltaproteobacteria bacterium]